MKRIYLLLTFLLINISLFAQTTFKIYKSGNYIYIENNDTGLLIDGGLSAIEFRKVLQSSTAYRVFQDGKTIIDLNFDIDVSQMQDENGIAYTQASFETFKENNSGFSQDVNIQDQHSPAIIAFFSLLEEETLLTNTVAIGDYDMTVDVVTGIAVGEYVSIFNVAANRFYLGTILSISVNTLTMDTPMDFAFPSGSFVTSGIRNMNVNGSVTPVIFGLRNTDTAIGKAFDITRLMFTCLTTNAVDLSKFGDIVGGLTRGIVVRSKNGVFQNILNAKTNGDLKNFMFDFDVASATNPAQGQHGFSGQMTFAGQNKIGVTIRLEPGEDIQIIIQDDLTTLLDFKIIAEGHEVVNGIFILLLFYRKRNDYKLAA